MPISKYGGQEGNEEKEEGIAPRSGLRPRLNRKGPQVGNVPAGEGASIVCGRSQTGPPEPLQAFVKNRRSVGYG